MIMRTSADAHSNNLLTNSLQISYNYAPPSSGEAYSDRQLTLNFKF